MLTMNTRMMALVLLAVLATQAQALAASACGQRFTAIHQVQGPGEQSPLQGQTVTVEAVLTQVLPGLQGFTLQGREDEWDQDPRTSEGLFVFASDADLGALVRGQRLRVRGQVQERFGQTQLAMRGSWTACGPSELPPVTVLALPVDSLAVWEAHEGMLVSFSQPLTVNDNYNLARFGELTLSQGRRFMPTQVVAPGAKAQALAAEHVLNRILLDDGSYQQNPALVPYPAPELSADNTVRVGDQVQPFVATLHYAFNEYRLHPVTEPQFVATNPRPEVPNLTGEGNLVLASFNVFNYFNGDGDGDGFPTARGARTANDFGRQRAKIVAALEGLNADVIALMEMENDGFAEHSALADLTLALAAATDQPWAYAQAEVAKVGSDQITQAIVYRRDRVRPSAPLTWLSRRNSPRDASGQPLFNDRRNRPALVQRFQLLANDAEFVLVVNHLKAKSSSCAADGDPDMGDGQGHCNLTRTRAAQAMAQWLAEQPELPIWIVGDLNAYAQEDPIRTLAKAGYESAFTHLGKDDAYSYVYMGQSGQLDHALGNRQALATLVDASVWHINADEPRALAYSPAFKSARQRRLWYAADAYRSSDHDPLLLLLKLKAQTDKGSD